MIGSSLGCSIGSRSDPGPSGDSPLALPASSAFASRPSSPLGALVSASPGMPKLHLQSFVPGLRAHRSALPGPPWRRVCTGTRSERPGAQSRGGNPQPQ